MVLQINSTLWTELTSGLSTILGLLTLFVIICFKKFHTSTFKFVAMLTIMELLADSNFFFTPFTGRVLSGKFYFSFLSHLSHISFSCPSSLLQVFLLANHIHYM